MTDVWSWVYEKERQLREQGEDALASSLGRIPQIATNGERATLEAVFHTAVDRARTLDEPWVEVFLRHWRLQCLLLYDVDTRAAVPEAASLIEFCSRPETRDCPQSICAVQDFCIAFGNVDGPGYADDRIGIALDTLARIEPTRSCYGCLVTELVDAYIDKGEPDKALAFLETDGAHVKAGMQPRDLEENYHVAAAEIAIAKLDCAALAKHGKKLSEHGGAYRSSVGRAYIAFARANGKDERARAAALANLEPWHELYQHRYTLDVALRAITGVFDLNQPDGANAALWVGRLRDGCLQLATDGASSNAITRAVAAAPIVARVLGTESALAMLHGVEPELSRLKDPRCLATKFAAAREKLLTQT